MPTSLGRTTAPLRHPTADPPATAHLSSSPRVLLVDDDEHLRSLMAAILSGSGYRVQTASCAEEALLRSSTSPSANLLLTDLQMPGLNGLELAEALTRNQPLLPVLLISGSILSSDSLHALRTRGWSFLPKPFLISSLLDAVHSTIAHGRSPLRQP